MNLIKRLVVFLTTFLLIFQVFTVSAANDWFVSDDNMLEVRFISLEETTYPEFTLKLQFRLDGELESETFSYYYDLTSLFNSYIAKNPSYKNRKVKVTSEGIFVHLKSLRGTQFESKFKVTFGKDAEYFLTANIDLATIYPDEFVNYDVLNAAEIINKYKEYLLNPSSMEVSEVSVHQSSSSENITYYTISISAQNRMGGKTNSTIVGRYIIEKGRYDIFRVDLSDIGDSEFVFKDTGISGSIMDTLLDWSGNLDSKVTLPINQINSMI